jgi:hypothetical protein
LTAALVAIVLILGGAGCFDRTKDNAETVTKARTKGASTLDSDLPKIPSKLSNKNTSDLALDAPSFQVNTNLVSVDVAVLDNKGHFIPNIPKGNFRILEDNVPQPISTVLIGEAPITVCVLIEFSNGFQQ